MLNQSSKQGSFSNTLLLCLVIVLGMQALYAFNLYEGINQLLSTDDVLVTIDDKTYKTRYYDITTAIAQQLKEPILDKDQLVRELKLEHYCRANNYSVSRQSLLDRVKENCTPILDAISPSYRDVWFHNLCGYYERKMLIEALLNDLADIATYPSLLYDILDIDTSGYSVVSFTTASPELYDSFFNSIPSPVPCVERSPTKKYVVDLYRYDQPLVANNQLQTVEDEYDMFVRAKLSPVISPAKRQFFALYCEDEENIDRVMKLINKYDIDPLLIKDSVAAVTSVITVELKSDSGLPIDLIENVFLTKPGRCFKYDYEGEKLVIYVNSAKDEYIVPLDKIKSRLIAIRNSRNIREREMFVDNVKRGSSNVTPKYVASLTISDNAGDPLHRYIYNSIQKDNSIIERDGMIYGFKVRKLIKEDAMRDEEEDLRAYKVYMLKRLYMKANDQLIDNSLPKWRQITVTDSSTSFTRPEILQLYAAPLNSRVCIDRPDQLIVAKVVSRSESQETAAYSTCLIEECNFIMHNL